ncbi:hypothetical protein Vretifemale_13551 [Volvox reticuliferus]|uniref:Protein kinase domain-containing protein n=1 Tax=Volvox reticuliferus TaxID=1737510 RepID=A0A8J4CPR0_9CHLO|nr:hypothetical protein Vretifemale_13551 [Volvox reticuliferus]
MALDLHTLIWLGCAQAPIAVSAISASPVTDKGPCILAPAEGALSANSSPPNTAHSILGTMPPGEFKAELDELLYIGQGATGLVYRASVTQLWDTGTDAPRPTPVSVAVKFMICNTPQQLWQRAKEALLSKLVSHPNLVRTLAMDVTLVTPNTYSEWGDLHRASLDAAAVSLTVNPRCPDGPTVFPVSVHPLQPRRPVSERLALETISTSQVPCIYSHDSGSTIGPLAVAEEPRQQTHPPPKRRCAEHQGTRLRNRTLGSVMMAAKSGFPAPLVPNLAQPRASLGSEAPCTVEPSELWPLCCDSSRSEGRSITASKATLWAQPGGGGSHSRESCGEVDLNLPLHSEVAPTGVIPGGGRGIDGDGAGGGGGIEGSGCMLCACGQGNVLPMVDQPEVFQQPGTLLGGVCSNLADDAVAGDDAGGCGEGDATGVVAGAAKAFAVADGNISDEGPHSSMSMGPPQSLTPTAKVAAAAAASASIHRPDLASQAITLVEVHGDMDGAAAPAMFMGIQVPHGSSASHESSAYVSEAVGQCGTARGVICTRGSSGDGGGFVDRSFRPDAGGGGCGAKGRPQHAEPVPFQDILYHLEALPGRFLAKVIMEYCDSGTLLQRINEGDYVAHPNKGPLAMLSATRALLWCLQEIAAGMAHLHSLNIIHGDLKPGNVLLTTQPGSPLGYVCKVSDFGLATALEASEQTITHENWGTVVYMAPESCAGRCRKASDVYSFGVLLWQMCTGERPYAGLQAGQVLLGVKMGTLKLQWPAWANKSLVKVGEACLRFGPKERPGFKGIRSALAKIAARLDNKMAAMEAAGIFDGPLLQSMSSAVLGMGQLHGADGVPGGVAIAAGVNEASAVDGEVGDGTVDGGRDAAAAGR